MTLFIMVSALFFCSLGAQSQTRMKISLNDGRTLLIPLDSISDILVQPEVPAIISQLTGPWQLIASANGTTDAAGISHAVTDTIDFVATVAPDGMGLVCQAQRFYTRSGNVYPAHWRMVVEEQDGQIRIGWVFDSQQPASSEEFNESVDKYMDGGFFYWGTGTEQHHYIYLLTENIEDQRLEGKTLWSSWTTTQQTSFSFPQNQGIYGVVGAAIPYSGDTSIGYFERWASPRFVRK